jgi:hypothetical protein
MASTATHAPDASGGSISRIFGVFFSPKETFASIAQRPTWLTPVILSCIVSLALIAVFTHHVGWRHTIEKQDQASAATAARMDQMTPQQREQMIGLQMKYAPDVAFAAAVIGPFLGVLIVAALFLALFNVVYSTPMSLKTSMGVVAYSFVPRILLALVAILVIFLKDPSQVDLQNPLASNPGALMASDTPQWLITLAGQIDFFSIWVIILLAIGYRAVNPKKVSMIGALGSVVALWAVYVIIRVAVAAALS